MEQIHGELDRDVLPDVLRHLRILLESGRLDVWSDAKKGVLVVRDGRPVHAACRYPDGSAARGVEALAMMIRWPSGHYAFREEGTEGEADHRHPADVPRPQHAVLPLEGLNGSASLRGDTEQILAQAWSLLGEEVAMGSTEQVAKSTEPSDKPTASNAPAGAPGPVPSSKNLEEGHAESVFADAQMRGKTALDNRLLDNVLANTVHDDTIFLRSEMADPSRSVTVSRGALELWLRLDGTMPLDALSEKAGEAMSRVRGWMAELRQEGLAHPAPERVYGREFVARLVTIVNEIMGPMGEIVVEDALEVHGLDPSAIPGDRLDALVEELAGQLQRSDWQLKLRARVARLRVDVGSGD
jgi:hypothetical protein